MEAKQVKIEAKEGVSTIEFLEGSALPKRESVKLNINGIIDTPVRFVGKRVEDLEQKQCHILVDRAKMSISLVIDETDYFSGSVVGKLEKHLDFDKWKINQGSEWGTKALSEFIKMNRSCFADKETAMKLSSELQNLRVKTDKEIERSDDNKGSFKVAIAQKVIDSSIPDVFAINVPIFKGQPAKEIQIEIYVNPETFNVGLVSPEANDIIEQTKNTVIDEQLDEIKEICSEIVIVEQ